jgi:methionyl-tRNA formyltransferase
MRLVFMGTPHFAATTLSRLRSDGHEIRAVYTRAPRPAGRKLEPRPSAVEHIARGFGLPIFTPQTLRNDDEQALFRTHEADAAVVVAYGMILPKAVLDTPRLGCFNLHASLLPRWRGAAPINRAIMAGDADTGVMVMKMDEGLDTGPIVSSREVAIKPLETASDLTDRLADIGADLMAEALKDLANGTLSLMPQSEQGVTYAHKIEKSETRIDWSQPSSVVHNHCRGLAPSPGAWFEIARRGAPERVKVWRTMPVDGSGAPGTILDDGPTIACGEGAVRLLQVQRAGREPITGHGFWHGLRLSPGATLG